MKTVKELKKENIFVKDFGDYVIRFRCPVITIYNDETLDYNGLYVARLFVAKEGKTYPTKIVCINTDLEKLKEAIPGYMIFFDRSEKDDKCIIGTYI